MATHLPHTSLDLLGKRVRITRNGFQYVGTVTSAGPHEGAGGGLSLILDLEDVGGVTNSTGFHLPSEAVVEDLGDDTPPEERTVVVVGLDGRSQPMRRYADELHLPEHMRSVPPPPSEELTHQVLDPAGNLSEPMTYKAAKFAAARWNANRDGCDALVVPVGFGEALSPPCAPQTVAGRGLTHVVIAPNGETSEPLTFGQAKARQDRLNEGLDGCDYIVAPVGPAPRRVAAELADD